MINDRNDLLHEAKDCVKDVVGEVMDYGYVTPTLIQVDVVNSDGVSVEDIQAEIDSWGNLPLKVENIVQNKVLISII